jgi:hypothetical protein
MAEQVASMLPTNGDEHDKTSVDLSIIRLFAMHPDGVHSSADLLLCKSCSLEIADGWSEESGPDDSLSWSFFEGDC